MELSWVVRVALVAYLVLSLVTFLSFWLDKRASMRDGRRTPEATLHLLEALGGWPGALLAQQILRHKSRKVSFRVVTWAIVALHGIGWWLYFSRN